MDFFIPIFAALEAAGVHYVVVGGVATVFHGYARLTVDIDLVVHLEPANCLKAIKVLTELGFKPRAPVNPNDFADPQVRQRWIEEKGLTVMTFYRLIPTPLEVDLFLREPFDFGDLWRNRADFQINGTPIHVIDKQSLITMKRAAARSRDLEDVEALEKIDNG